MSAPTILESGRVNAVSSFMKWLTVNVPTPLPAGLASGPITFGVVDRRPVAWADITTPIVSIVDLGMFQPQASDVDDLLTQVQGGTDFYGREAQTLLEVVVWASRRVQQDAEYRVQRIRDSITSAYLLAGRFVATDPRYVPPIELLNYADGSKAPLGQYIHRDRSSTWFVESDIQDPAHPEVIAWRMLTRVLWWEFMAA